MKTSVAGIIGTSTTANTSKVIPHITEGVSLG